MAERIFYLNGEYVRESEAKISIHDRGFTFGDAAYDISRTFNHQPFKWLEHIDRLFCSLRYIQIDPGLTPQQIYDITLEVFKRNEVNLGQNDDYLIIHRVTRGEGLFTPPEKPTVLIYCHPIAFEVFARKYTEGVHVVVASTRRIPPQCLDPKAKLQNKLNHILAELEAKSVAPDAYALMLDLEGCIAECSAQNLFIVKEERLLTPTRGSILEGITRATILDLAKEIGIESAECNLYTYDLYNADEIFISANSFTMFPVAKVDTKTLGKPIPGPVTERLLAAWNKTVGIDIVQQAQSHLN
ncbi:aminotransferase class IV [Chloroflexota bacterium]